MRPDFDIALSFAGDHRPFVAEVAAGLKDRGFRVFYDQYRREDLLGQELIAYLQEVYGRRSAMVAAFISEQYVARNWPRHERQSALAYALLRVSAGVPFLLPLRFDDTVVPGLQPTVGYEDLRELQPGERRWRDDRRYKHPKHVVSLLTKVLAARGLGPKESNFTVEESDPHILVHFVWFSAGGTHHGDRLIPVEDYEDAVAELAEDETDRDGPAPGRYVRISEHLEVIVNPERRLPVFMIDTHHATQKAWVAPLPDLNQELAVVEHVKRQVQQAVDMEIKAGGLPISSTQTIAADDSPLGPGRAVTGICVVAVPKYGLTSESTTTP
ncbi:TIR domain-containing protein [Geodermatophilus sp. SYSU D00814]